MKELFEIFVYPFGKLLRIGYAYEIATNELCFLAIGNEEAQNLTTKGGWATTVSTACIEILEFTFLIFLGKSVRV